jgi:hypothetical protein
MEIKRVQKWEELLWNLSESISPYTADEWTIITDGLVDSFCEFLNLPFEKDEPPWFELEHREQHMGMALIYKFETPVEPLVYYIRGGVTTYISSDNNRTIDVSLALFIYFGKTRLLGEIESNPERKNDFILFTFDRDKSGLGEWKNEGWQEGFMDEWLGLKYRAIRNNCTGDLNDPKK